MDVVFILDLLLQFFHGFMDLGGSDVELPPVPASQL